MNNKKARKRLRKGIKLLLEIFQQGVIIPNLPEPNAELGNIRQSMSVLTIKIVEILENPYKANILFPCFVDNKGITNILAGYQLINTEIGKPIYDDKSNIIGELPSPEFEGIEFPLIRLYGLIHGMTDCQVIVHLQDQLQIDTSSSGKIDIDEKWFESTYIPDKSNFLEYYPHHGINGGHIFTIIAQNIGGNRVLTPLTPLTRKGFLQPLALSIMPQRDSWPMFNANSCIGKEIAIVSNDVALIQSNATHCQWNAPEISWCGWHGSNEMLSGYDFSPLIGKSVFYSMKGLSPLEDVKTALVHRTS